MNNFATTIKNGKPYRRYRIGTDTGMEIELSEHQVQCAFVQMCLWAEAHDARLSMAFAVPNGGGRSAIQGALLKAEGQRNGVPDWMLPCPCGHYAGLAIEFKKPPFEAVIDGKKIKRPAGVLSTEQKKYIPMLQANYWQVHVCDNPFEAFEIVKGYLNLPNDIIDHQLTIMEYKDGRFVKRKT